MSNQMTINNSFFAGLDLMKETLEDGIKDELTDLAAEYVAISPVDTGAYVTSGSFVPKGSGGGRRRSSDNKPTGQNKQEMRDIAFSQLMSDLAKMDLTDLSGVTLRNRSPHSNNVEDGGPNWRSSGKGVFRKLRKRYG